jgi:hypothetical protein
VLAELDREAVERAGVQALEKALNDEFGAKVEAGDLADDVGAEVLFGAGHGVSIRVGSLQRPARRAI